MPRARPLQLHTHALAERVRAMGVPQWWIAQQLGVHRKTVSRWLSGRVRGIEPGNAEALAALLDCDPGAILTPEAVFATPAEQRRAAALIQERDLLELLSPRDEWELAERLIKATLEPDLPVVDLARLYGLLAIASWRQDRTREATAHAEHARALARRIGDREIAARATTSLGTIAWIEERYDDARALYREALAGPAHNRRDRGSTLFNLGFLERSAGHLEQAVTLQSEAVSWFEPDELVFNLAIAWTGIGITHTELRRPDHARVAFDRAEGCARRCDYRRGLAQLTAYRLDVGVLRGEPAPRRVVDEALAAAEAQPGVDPAVYEVAARALRHRGDLDHARATLDRAAHGPAPSFLAACICLERARLDRASGALAEAQASWHWGEAMLRGLGLVDRAPAGPIREPWELAG